MDSDSKLYTIKYFTQAQKEYNNLDGSQKVFVDKAINRIKKFGMQCGANLYGELEGCKKLKNKKMGLRVIFRQDIDSVKIIQIVAIGKRRDLDVYFNAEQRLRDL